MPVRRRSPARRGDRDGVCVALFGWSAPRSRWARRDPWIGWVPEQQFRRLHLVANNARFLVLPGYHGGNLGVAGAVAAPAVGEHSSGVVCGQAASEGAGREVVARTACRARSASPGAPTRPCRWHAVSSGLGPLCAVELLVAQFQSAPP